MSFNEKWRSYILLFTCIPCFNIKCKSEFPGKKGTDQWSSDWKLIFGPSLFLSCLIDYHEVPPCSRSTHLLSCRWNTPTFYCPSLPRHAFRWNIAALFFLFSLTSTRCLPADACKVPWWCYMPSDLWLHRLISTRTNFQHGRHIQISIFYVLRNVKRQMNQINTGARNISMCKIKKDFIRIGYFSILVNPYVQCMLILYSTLIACIY